MDNKIMYIHDKMPFFWHMRKLSTLIELVLEYSKDYEESMKE